ncbi:glycosyltransferase family 2 protein [Rhizobium sp. Rhizsp42]|uniref:glycosyltransferase family 2 protein n=1 Tax=Rhizobium sp. Rhizsp42 TaxID=3243034 RepID=UPI0039B02251
MLNKLSSEAPLVSVGIPTYNRPDLLELAIKKILSQTWSNIEVVISDNASSDPRVAEVITRYTAVDDRIRAFRQRSNIGALKNFLFLLEEARGEFFMWAADDDDWDVDFIEFAIANIGSAGLLMGDFNTVFHARDQVIHTKLPKLDPERPVLENLIRFNANMQPTLIYGLHRTKSLRASIPAGSFFFWDCAVVYSIMLNYGIRTVEGSRYRAGVHSSEYEIKQIDPKVRQLTYWPFLSQLLKDTFKCPRLSMSDKIFAALSVVNLVRKLKAHHTKQAK